MTLLNLHIPFRKPVSPVSVHAFLAVTLSLFSVACGDATQTMDKSGSETAAITMSDPIARQLFNQYRVMPYLSAGFYQFEWEDYARCLPQEARELFSETAQQLGINKYDLFTVAMGEGLGFYFDRGHTANSLLNGPVDGFVYLGVDFFLTGLAGFKSKGLLPQNFSEGTHFSVRQVERNEPGDNGTPITLNVPVFFGMRNALLAMGANYTDRQIMARDFAQKSGRGALNKDEISFWSYYFYQNPTLARNSMSSNGKRVFATGEDSVRPKGIRNKSVKRVVTARYLESYRTLESDVPCELSTPAP